MNTTDKLFYSVLKNEDAMPFVGDGLLIVADGLGGSGSTVHHIPARENITLHDEIFKSAFHDFDFTDTAITNYLEYLVSPMADGDPDTSALWASRIAIARCAYALCRDKRFANADLSDKTVRAQLSAFISAGLDSTARWFDFKEVKYDSQRILPTTLALIRYRQNADGSLRVEVVWAGDSRCYLLTASGLEQLSADDEDTSNSITNLFYAGSKRPTVLNYRKYDINVPCVLIAASDGVFDPFEPHGNLGVEDTLLKHIAQNETYGGLMASLSAFYDYVHSDDASMAFVPIGFKSYDDLKKVLMDRTLFISEICRKLYDMETILKVAGCSEESVRRYIETRTSDKFTAVVADLIANRSVKGDDPAYTEEVDEKLTEARMRIDELLKKETADCVRAAVKMLREEMKAQSPENPDCYFNASLPDDIPQNIVLLKNSIMTSADSVRRSGQHNADKREITKIKDEFLKAVAEREHYYWQKFDESRNKISPKQRDEYCRCLRIWTNVDMQLCKGYAVLKEINHLDSGDRKLANMIRDFICKNKALLVKGDDVADMAIAIERDNYCGYIDSLFDILVDTPSVCEKLFNDDVLARFHLTGAADISSMETKCSENRLLDAIYSQKDEVVHAVVGALAKNYDKTSMLDGYYNAGKLKEFRAYYKLKAHPDTSATEFGKQLKELESAYERRIFSG